jgi:hypothetical protein
VAAVSRRRWHRRPDAAESIDYGDLYLDRHTNARWPTSLEDRRAEAAPSGRLGYVAVACLKRPPLCSASAARRRRQSRTNSACTHSRGQPLAARSASRRACQSRRVDAKSGMQPLDATAKLVALRYQCVRSCNSRMRRHNSRHTAQLRRPVLPSRTIPRRYSIEAPDRVLSIICNALVSRPPSASACNYTPARTMLPAAKPKFLEMILRWTAAIRRGACQNRPEAYPFFVHCQEGITIHQDLVSKLMRRMGSRRCITGRAAQDPSGSATARGFIEGEHRLDEASFSSMGVRRAVRTCGVAG